MSSGLKVEIMSKDDKSKVILKGIIKMLNNPAVSHDSLNVTLAPTHTCSQIRPELNGTEVTLAGWAQEIRNLGGVAFVILRDGSGEAQITLLKDIGKAFKKVGKLNRESIIAVSGKVQKTEQSERGVEVLASDVQIYSKAQTPLPLGVVDKVNAEMDTRLDNRVMDLRKLDVQAVFRIRAAFLQSVRSYLEEKNFVEVNTPKIVAAATEGGTDLFPIKYFKKDAYLNQSPQLYKQMLMATGLNRVYEIGPAFRAEPHDTVRHLNEFTSIDIEMCYADDHKVMDILEGLIKQAAADIKYKCESEINTLGIEWNIPDYSFPRITYTDVIERLQSAGVDIEWGADIGMEEIKTLVKEDSDFTGYYYIIDWPTESKPFYVMPHPDRPEISRGFDLMFAEKEITSGAQRVHDYYLLVEQLKARKLKPRDFTFYLDAFRYGMPPHAGWGLGTERMIMIFTQRKNIRECVLFPRDRHRLSP